MSNEAVEISNWQVRNREIDSHELTLVTTSDGLMLYAFTFTSCVAGIG